MKNQMILNEWDESTSIIQSLFIVDEPRVRMDSPVESWSYSLHSDEPQRSLLFYLYKFYLELCLV